MSKYKQKLNGDNISSPIQINFKQMHVQTNKSTKVSPIIRTSYETIFNSLNNIATSNGNMTKNINIKKDLFSRRQRKKIRNHNSESPKTGKMCKKQGNNKIMQKNAISQINNNNRMQENVNGLLSNDCPLNSQFIKLQMTVITQKRPLLKRNNQSQKQKTSQMFLALLNNSPRNKRYNQIRFTKNVRFNQSPAINTNRCFSIDNKSISSERRRKHLNNTLNKISFNERVQDYLHSAINTINWNAQTCNENKAKKETNDELKQDKTDKENFQKQNNFQKCQEQKTDLLQNNGFSKNQVGQASNTYFSYRKTKQTTLFSATINNKNWKQRKHLQYSPWQQIKDEQNEQNEKCQNIFDSKLF